MTAPTDNSAIYSIITPHGNIRAKIGSEEDNLTIILSYNDLATTIENAGKNNWAELNLKIYIEIERINHPEQTTVTNLPIPEEIIYLTPQQLREMQK